MVLEELTTQQIFFFDIAVRTYTTLVTQFLFSFFVAPYVVWGQQREDAEAKINKFHSPQRKREREKRGGGNAKSGLKGEKKTLLRKNNNLFWTN